MSVRLHRIRCSACSGFGVHDGWNTHKAKGLYQIWPATGRWLAGELGWDFSEAILYEPAKNTELVPWNRGS